MKPKNEAVTAVVTSTVDVKAAGLKSWVCSGQFDDAMLRGFMSFYEGLLKDGDRQAIIYIDSPGGYLHTLDGILSVMESSDIEWFTCAIGEACSAALILLASGKRRYAGARARLMYHSLAFGTQGKVDAVQENADDAKLLNQRTTDDFAKKTKKPAAWWVSQTRAKETRDFVFYAEEALKYGVVDRIGVPQLKVTRKVE
jgi:ATP-dependent protease ClpP protease subunit